MRRRELSRAAMTINEKSRRRPHACALEDTPHDAGEICGRAGLCTLWGFAAGRKGPLDLPLDV